MFVKNLALVVYGHDTLINSSVSGMKCNAKENAVPKPRLDSSKLLAIKDIYHHYLMKNLHYEEPAADLEAKQTTIYISRKIADMCRAPKEKMLKEDVMKKNVKKLDKYEGSKGARNSATEKNTKLASISDNNDEATGQLCSQKD